LGRAAGGTENDVTPFVAEHGRIVVAWYETQLCSGGCVSPGFVRVAVQPAAKSRFRPEQVLNRDNMGLARAPIGASFAPIVIAARGHSPMVIFLARGATPPMAVSPGSVGVKVAYPKGLGFAAPQTISPVDQQASDVAAAAGPNGVILTWIREDPPSYYTGTVFAAVRLPETGLFGQPEQVSPSEHAISALPTFNIASRWPNNSIAPWTVAWASRPLSEASTVVRVSSPLCPSPLLQSPAVLADRACSGA
jgi:hypothetical protein